MNPKYAILFVVASLAIGTAATQTAFGQSIQITEGIELSTEQVIFIIIIGSIAGAIRAWQGYDKSPNDFDFLYFVNGVRDAVLVSIPIAFATALGLPEITPVGYVIIFFSVFGATQLGQKAKQKSIPSNATNEEIAKILEERG